MLSLLLELVFQTQADDVERSKELWRIIVMDKQA